VKAWSIGPQWELGDIEPLILVRRRIRVRVVETFRGVKGVRDWEE